MGKTKRRTPRSRPAESGDALPASAPPVAFDYASTKRPGKPPVSPPAAWRVVLLFGPVIFGGALLLFAVQPLIGRFLLPWFGGTPGVWTTCMLFFQSLLLGGYLYAHVLVRYLPVRAQVVVHTLLVIASLATLPIIPSTTWRPVDAGDPTWRIILLLSATVGLPYLVLSATSPLLQAWLVKASPGVSPYRMFALSNLGSLIALLGYPLFMEPYLTRQQQAWTWSVGMVVFAVVCVSAAAFVWRRAGARRGEAVDDVVPPPSLDPIAKDESSHASATTLGPWVQWGMWLSLPLVASVLLLAITNTLSQDVAVVPFLWVLPLALYLLTFIIAFDGPRWYPRAVVAPLLAVSAIWLIRVQWIGTAMSLAEQIIGPLVSMFVVCLFCHGELARLKPEPRRLTTYYLTISLGGALGGVVVALAAPRLFDRYLELPLGLMVAAALAAVCYRHWPVPKSTRWVTIFGVASVGLLGFTLLGRAHEVDTPLERTRNFYGAMTVFQYDHPDPKQNRRWLAHGSIQHGTQLTHPDLRREPTTYYRRGEGGGFSLAMDYFPRNGPRRVGVVGLGAGVLATYGQPGDTFRFYEINPEVERLAREYFTFLADSPAKCEVVIGDARVSLEREPVQQYDILVLDAFSGDAIPTHLLTREAVGIYLRHLKPDGALVVHISNRYLDLFHVVIQHAAHFRLMAPLFKDPGSTVMVLTRNKDFLLHPEVWKHVRRRTYDENVKPWTDDHVSLLRILRW